MSKLWVWLAGNLVTVAVIAIAAFLILTNVRGCRDKGQSTDAIVMAERIRADSLRAIADSLALAEANRRLELALANGVRVVDRWRESAPRPITTGTTRDTITQLTQQVRSCRAVGDSLVKSVVQIQSSCSVFRDTATRTIADLRTLVARKDSLIRIGKAPKRWSIGPVVMYGFYQDQSWAIKRGFAAGIGITYALIQW